MKTSLSRAFQPIGDRYRVGYSTISETGVADGTNFLNVRDFDATQKGKFYTAMNAATPSGYTPLRGALSKAGQYFGKKARNQTIDPMQYSCQKNFTILSTDGYWNTDDETSTYGPFDLAGNKVGQRDGVNAYPTARPKFDGGTTTVTNRITGGTRRRRSSRRPRPRPRSYTQRQDHYHGDVRRRHGVDRDRATAGPSVTNSNLTRCTASNFSGGNCTVTVDTSSQSRSRERQPGHDRRCGPERLQRHLHDHPHRQQYLYLHHHRAQQPAGQRIRLAARPYSRQSAHLPSGARIGDEHAHADRHLAADADRDDDGQQDGHHVLHDRSRSSRRPRTRRRRWW